MQHCLGENIRDKYTQLNNFILKSEDTHDRLVMRFIKLPLGVIIVLCPLKQ